jgi:hypothetical protein
MKPFRGTLIALIALAIIGGVYFVMRPEVTEQGASDEDCNQLFEFEKHELVRVDISQPGAEGVQISLSESSNGDWIIDGEDEIADRSMVNRAKHQIHDLCSRATIAAPEDAELYGLGELAASVTLTLRSEQTIRFLIGDPNPTNVSYYIQPDGDPNVYTVKKSASDFWFSELKAFRERRFARFDSKDAIALSAELLGEEGYDQLRFEQRGERDWDMTTPLQMSAHTEEIRRLLGRVQALKARDLFDVSPEERDERLAEHGLDEPRAIIEVSFASREPIRVFIGDEKADNSQPMTMSYMLLEGDDTIQIARDGLLEDFSREPSEFRNRRVVRMETDDVVAVDVIVSADESSDLVGKANVRYAAEQWLWEDGTQFPGSGAERVARSYAELEIENIVDEDPQDLAAFGLDAPRAEVTLTNRDDEQKVILVGGRGEPESFQNIDGETEVRERRFITVVGDKTVYVLSERTVLNVVDDIVRQRGKKNARDAERAANRERIPTNLTEEDEPR